MRPAKCVLLVSIDINSPLLCGERALLRSLAREGIHIGNPE